MYQAELKGKLSSSVEAKEDLLTSNVFSFFKYADRRAFLLPFLEKIGIDASPEDAANAEFHFWPKYDDRTEPDVVILLGDYYLLFEAKYFSDFGEKQISREFYGGLIEAELLEKDFKLIAITADYSKPQEKFENLDFDVLWINWQSVTLFLEDRLDADIPDYQFAHDLYKLLLKKNLRPFRNFSSFIMEPCFKECRIVFFDYVRARHRGKFIGFHRALESRDLDIKRHKTIFFYKYRRFDWEFKTLMQNLARNRVFFGENNE